MPVAPPVTSARRPSSEKSCFIMNSVKRRSEHADDLLRRIVLRVERDALMTAITGEEPQVIARVSWGSSVAVVAVRDREQGVVAHNMGIVESPLRAVVARDAEPLRRRNPEVVHFL